MKGAYPFSKYHTGVNPSHPGFKTRPPHDVFPEDIECVFEGQQNRGAIYIGNLEAAQSLDTLKKHRIQSILTACKNVHIRHPKQHVPFSLYIPGEDHENYDLSVHFDNATNFIHESRKETNILVHCMAGVSRSVTLVLAYMMKHLGMSYSQAFQHVQRKRNKINPNPGFIRQLQKYERQFVQRSRYRYSAEKVQTQGKSKYDNLYRGKQFSYKQVENSQNYKSKPQVSEYSKYSTLSYLQNSNIRHNPQYDQSNFYKSNSFFNKTPTHQGKNTSIVNNSSFGSTLNNTFQTIPRNNSNDRLKEVLNTMNTKKTDYNGIVRERSIQNLSRDLDDRISKIKQKYYENSTPAYEGKVNLTDYDRRWDRSHFQGKKVNNYVEENLARSRASRQSLRNSIYAPYNAARSVTYQYA